MAGGRGREKKRKEKSILWSRSLSLNTLVSWVRFGLNFGLGSVRPKHGSDKFIGMRYVVDQIKKN
jgi:hypothetical protein